MPINSRAKGKRGELEAVKYLKKLGFPNTRRTQQFNGLGKGDIICEDLPHIHFEVKFGYPISKFDLCTSVFRAACEQAQKDAEGKYWVVMWKPKGYRVWRLSYPNTYHVLTVAGDSAIAYALCHRM